ncbi:MAG: Gfo/Idh/MocA family oxidoreductase [Planctomycetota bacterium]
MNIDPQPSPARTLTRRSFVAGSAAALPLAAGCASAPHAQERDPFFAATREKQARTLKVGLVGCGGRGTGAALQTMKAENGSVVLHAIGDVFADKLEPCAKNLENALVQEFGEEGRARMDLPPERRFSGFDAYQRVVDSGVDVVCLATPPGFRPIHLEYAVGKGKHVFTEKPMAVDGPGLRRVMEVAARAKAQDTALVSGFCWRYNWRHRAFMAEIENGRLGDVHAVYTNYLTGQIGRAARKPEWSEMEHQLRTWHYHCWLSGDHVTEQAIHSLDKQAWLMGDRLPRWVDAVGGCAARPEPDSGNIFDHFAATFDYGDGVKAFHTARQWPNSHGENRDYVWGTRGHGVIENWTPKHQIVAGGTEWLYDGPGNDMYQQEHDELYHSIRTGKVINDGTWMATSTLLALMAREAAYSGARVEPQQILESERSLVPDAFVMGDLPAEHLPVPGSYRLA